MSDDLVKQLGEIADYAETDTSKAIWDYPEAFREAAARIEALEARAEEAEKMSERFKDERDLLHDLYTHGRVTVKSPFERILEAEAERDELRDALKPFLKLAVSLDDINRARAALNREAGT